MTGTGMGRVSSKNEKLKIKNDAVAAPLAIKC
jgi:hypothetical protein